MRRFLPLLAAAVFAGLTQAADEFLDPEVAFRLSGRALDAQRIEIRFDIAPGYYLYGDKFSVQASPPGVKLGALQVPKGTVKYDETFQKDVETFRRSVALTLTLAEPATAAFTPFELLVGNQGCADQGLCYPPTQRTLRVDAGQGGAPMRVSLLSEVQAASATPTPVAGGGGAVSEGIGMAGSGAAERGGFAAALDSKSLLWVAGAFVLAGLLLSLTPCVLPMLPILSSIIVGQSGAPTRGRGLRLALTYSMGMALVYTAFGMAAGLIGEGLAAALQNAWVLGAFALLLVVLSLSMFGAYELQMPAALQSRLAQWSGRLQGGRYAGVFAMGGLSAVIVSPCVAAPLAGALVYISQTRDLVLGGVALFAMAVGMSAPLILLGLSAGSVLPRAGAWMERIKHAFGFMLIGIALWIVAPVLPVWAAMVAAAALLLACAVFLGAFERLEQAVTPRRAMTKSAGILLAVLAALQLVGAASGGRDVLQPLAHWSGSRARPASAAAGLEPALAFQGVANLDALDTVLKRSTRLVMLDFYADWCVSCKEMEGLTFTDDSVRRRLGEMTLVRVDVTANSADDKALMRRYGLFGPPALLFFRPGGEELSAARVIGYQDARTFLNHLSRLEDAPGAISLSQR
ncbi:MAG: protein-disulfide reductase DsbD [Burkholderiaceae bacterium]